jgi:hypothetical protein
MDIDKTPTPLHNLLLNSFSYFPPQGKDRNAHLLKHLSTPSVHAPNTKFQEGRELRMQIATSQLF